MLKRIEGESHDHLNRGSIEAHKKETKNHNYGKNKQYNDTDRYYQKDNKNKTQQY